MKLVKISLRFKNINLYSTNKKMKSKKESPGNLLYLQFYQINLENANKQERKKFKR